MTAASGPSARRARTAVGASWLALAAAVLVLRAAGGVLPAPPLAAPWEWSAWMAGRDPVAVAFGIVRLVALGAAGYGLVVSAVGVALRLVSARHLAALVDRLTVVALRRLVATTVAVGISAVPLGMTAAIATPVTAATPATGPHDPPATITMHRADTVSDAPSAAPSAPPASAPSAPPLAAPSPAPSAVRPPATASDSRPTSPPGVGAVASPTTTWTVEPGQCFWSIAEARLARTGDHPPTTEEIVAYWHQLIEANRGVLSDPRNADLVFPGQVFSLPAP